MYRKLASLFVSVLAATSAVQAGTILFDLQAEALKDSLGNPMATTGLVLLVADTTQNGFSSLSDGSSLALNAFLNGTDDKVLGRFNLSKNITPGLLLEAPSITYGSGWDIGDPLALLWFPTLNTASTTATSGNSYGFFSGAALNGSDAWVTPADATSGYKLFMFTSDAGNFPGTQAPSAGVASLTVAGVPEPSRALLGMIGLGVLALRRRR